MVIQDIYEILKSMGAQFWPLEKSKHAPPAQVKISNTVVKSDGYNVFVIKFNVCLFLKCWFMFCGGICVPFDIG